MSASLSESSSSSDEKSQTSRSSSTIPLFKVFMAKEAHEMLGPVLQSGYIAQGPKVEEFEMEIMKRFKYSRVLSLNSATSGLTLAVKLLNLQPGDEVISTPLTCCATNWPILANGLKIKWADVDPQTCNISLDSIRHKISEKTKALMVVHWGGYPVDLDGIMDIVEEAKKKYGTDIQVIEDCAHAFGATYKGKKIGTSHGNICIFSLQAIKHLTTGDGGLIFLPTEEMYARAKLLRWFGIDRNRRSGGGDLRMEPDIPEFGYKYHMNDINATIGLANLPYVDGLLKRMRDIAITYRQKLYRLNGITLLEEEDDYDSARWIFTLKVKDKSGFIKYMTDKGIMVSQVHNRNDGHSCVSEFKADLPNLDKLVKEIICIPAGWWMSDDDVQYVVNCIEDWSQRELQITSLKVSEWKDYLELIKSSGFIHSIHDQISFIRKLNSIENAGGHIFVGKLNGMVVCTGRINVEPKMGDSVIHIEDILVHPDFRGLGHGSAMVEYLVGYGKSFSPYKIILDCKDELVPFYQKAVREFKREGSEVVLRMPRVETVETVEKKE